MLFSIVIPLYNKEGQIANTLRSVFAQTCTDYEIVIVNDGSTDGSAAAVEAINDPRIRLIHQQNAGVSAARNRGIAEARGQYIALLDADDEWKPEYLATIAELIHKYPDCEVFATNYEFSDSKGNVTPTIINKLSFTTSDGILTNYFEVASCSHPPLWTSAVATSKTALGTVSSFPLGIKAGEDLITWARLALKYKIAYNTNPLARFLVDYSVQNQDQKDRKPAEFDYVGNELKKLYNSNKDIIGLKSYVSLWHKMRCRIFISKHDNKNAVRESLKALQHKISIKNIIFLGLSVTPPKLANRIINKFS